MRNSGSTPIFTLAFLLLGQTALAAPSVPYPSYTVGPQTNGSIVASNAQILTPTGQVVDLGSQVRAKAVAVNPVGNTAAVLTMGATAPVQIINLQTGMSIQSFIPSSGANGSYGGIAYTPDGTKLLFSQDTSNLVVANVGPTGKLSQSAVIALPATTSLPLNTPGTAYPGGIAVSADGSRAYVTLNQNNTLGVIDLTQSPPALVRQIPVGNAPHSVAVIGRYAYVSNEGGRPASSGDTTDLSSGTPIVTDPSTDTASTGTVSVIDTTSDTVVQSIGVGLHPTGLAVAGRLLFVANSYDDSLSIIDTTAGRVIRTVSLAVPVAGAYGVMPSSIAVSGSVAYVTLSTANAIAVVDLSGSASTPILGYLPTEYFPTSVALAPLLGQVVVSNDKGSGTRGSLGTSYGVTSYNTHEDTGTVSIIPLPGRGQLAALTRQVQQNNHWDLAANTQIGPQYANPNAAPVAIPAHIGEPSLIKHVFLIIKENRTYDQVLGDVGRGRGDSSLAVFGSYTPNQHALVQRFPLLDNVYAPSRQSADGHPWIVSSIAPYADEIQSPDWVRSYPGGNSNDAMVYMPKGFLWQAAQNQGLSVRMYGEWSGLLTISGTPSWSDWYLASQILEGTAPSGATTTITPDSDTESSTVPSVTSILDPHYPSFNTGIPDQYRVDIWLPQFLQQEATGTLPALTIMWLPDDHTSGVTPGFPIPTAAQADNDLALGRIVDAISHSNDWPTTAIFVEEDDAQDGVDHIDGHRQPAYVISPYASQYAPHADHTTYTAENINRTIEQILGMTPLTQFDLVASPMTTAFTNTPNFAPFSHLPPSINLATFPTSTDASPLERAWQEASAAMFKGKTASADAVDETALNRAIWYSATGFARPYPGEAALRWPAEFPKAKIGDFDDDD